MGLRKRKRGLSEVNMSSMTDIIFFLLVFFMLTSTLVKFHEMELPQSDSRAKAPKKIAVDLDKDGKVYVEGEEVPPATLEAAMKKAVADNPPDPEVPMTVTVAAEIGVPFERVGQVITIANRMKLKAILATEPRE